MYQKSDEPGDSGPQGKHLGNWQPFSGFQVQRHQGHANQKKPKGRGWGHGRHIWNLHKLGQDMEYPLRRVVVVGRSVADQSDRTQEKNESSRGYAAPFQHTAQKSGVFLGGVMQSQRQSAETESQSCDDFDFIGTVQVVGQIRQLQPALGEDEQSGGEDKNACPPLKPAESGKQRGTEFPIDRIKHTLTRSECCIGRRVRKLHSAPGA
jgi:hypothetical protein